MASLRTITVTTLVVIFSFLGVSLAKTLECKKTGACSCQMSDNSGAIDLSRVSNSGFPAIDARYKDVKSKDASSYSFNPCWPFEEVGCHGVAICQRVPDRRAAVYFTLGTHETAQFLHNGTHVILKYEGKSGTGHAIRTSWITLICNEENDDTLFIPIGEDPYVKPMHYYFALKSPCACPGKCSDSERDEKKESHDEKIETKEGDDEKKEGEEEKIEKKEGDDEKKEGEEEKIEKKEGEVDKNEKKEGEEEKIENKEGDDKNEQQGGEGEKNEIKEGEGNKKDGE
ncbi:uncharacterized protein [Ptychodera flava]|uniref:uncharacterized protein n=1 Tax=Ptychodera flava TaxID=63121 RepID=UPI00396AA28E